MCPYVAYSQKKCLQLRSAGFEIRPPGNMRICNPPPREGYRCAVPARGLQIQPNKELRIKAIRQEVPAGCVIIQKSVENADASKMRPFRKFDTFGLCKNSMKFFAKRLVGVKLFLYFCAIL